MVDWLKRGEAILPSEQPPVGEDDKATRLEYIERLLNSFCARREIADKLLAAAQPEDPQ